MSAALDTDSAEASMRSQLLGVWVSLGDALATQFGREQLTPIQIAEAYFYALGNSRSAWQLAEPWFKREMLACVRLVFALDEHFEAHDFEVPGA